MRRAALLGVLVLAACSDDPGRQDAGGTDAGADAGGGGSSRWAIHEVTGPDGLAELDLAVGPGGRVGLAYVATLGEGDGGLTHYELRYREWSAQGLTAPEAFRVVQRRNGLELAFQGNGEPAATYVGGGNLTRTGGTSAYWHQSDAVISYRSGGTWTEQVVTRFGDETTCPDVNSNLGFVVGIDAALAFDGATAHLAWRDGHFGAFTGPQDWNGSDLEYATGSPDGWTRQCVLSGAGNDGAWGAHLQMILVGGQPALVSDQLFGTDQGGGRNLVFNRRRPDGTWAPMVRPIETLGNTMSGPSLAWDPQLGFAIAVADKTQEALYFTRSVNDGVTWTEQDPVYQAGSGGWYPSLSIHPDSHDPSIAFYVCARAAGVPEGACPAAEDDLRIAERIGGIWREEVVDPEGGWRPKLAHLPDGRRVIAYRDPRSGAVKLAVEQ